MIALMQLSDLRAIVHTYLKKSFDALTDDALDTKALTVRIVHTHLSMQKCATQITGSITPPLYRSSAI